VIDQLAKTLSLLASAPPGELAHPDAVTLLGDCADAVRLALDCMQEALTPSQRASLERLSDLLEEGDSSPHLLADAARRAREALALDAIDPAHQALLAGDLIAWRRALGAPADFPQTRDECGATCLELAIYHAPVSLVEELIEMGAEVNYDRHAGFPSLFAAVDRQAPGHVEVVRLLLEAGADVQQRGINDYTALHYAATRDDAFVVELLLQHGADLTARTRIDHLATPLEEAERHGHARGAAAIRDWLARAAPTGASGRADG
jgi:ankyrin repeat protein